MKRRTIISGSAIAMMLLLVTGCGTSGTNGDPGNSDADSVQEALDHAATLSDDEREEYLIEKTAELGPVLIYSVQSPLTNDALNKKIAEDYPDLDIQFARVSALDGPERLRADVLGDVKDGASMALFGSQTTATFTQEDLLARYDSPYRALVEDELKDDAGYYTASTILYFLTGYNSDLVKEKDLPKTIAELADSNKWSGPNQIATTENGLNAFSAAVISYYGEEEGMRILEKLAAQKPLLAASHGVIFEGLSSGQFAIAYDTILSFLISYEEKGAPVSYFLTEPVFRYVQYSMIAKNAPNPYGAALVSDWLLKPDGAHAMYNDIPIGGVISSVPYIYEDILKGKEMATYSVESLGGDPGKWSDLAVKLFH